LPLFFFFFFLTFVLFFKDLGPTFVVLFKTRANCLKSFMINEYWIIQSE